MLRNRAGMRENIIPFDLRIPAIVQLPYFLLAPVAQLDRVLASGAKGFGFDSRRAHSDLLEQCETRNTVMKGCYA